MEFKKYFKELIIHSITPARFLMHRALEENRARIISPCVDLGGGEQTYLEHILCDENEKIILVDRESNADVHCDLEQKLPFSDGQFKTVLIMNVMELIYNYEMLCKEIYRILSEGGKVYVWVPFLINCHSQPNDYFRYTDQALEKIFDQAGFSHTNVQAYGGLGLVIGTYLGQLSYKFKFGASIIHMLAFLMNKLIDLVKRDVNAVKWPLGYFVVATK